MQKRAALYVRVSTEAQAEEGYSIDEQLIRLRAYCKAQDWVVAGVYQDPGFSGSSLERPGIRALMGAAADYDVVAVYRLDRLSRSQRDTLYLIEDVFAPVKTDFVSITESFDTSTSVGKAMVGILSAFSQLERERIKERMQDGRIGRAKSGKAMRWTSTPYGYRYVDGGYEIDELEARAVRAAYRWYLEGESQSAITRRLQAEYPKPEKSPWAKSKVKRVLTNPVYIGKVRYLDGIYDGVHEPIISTEQFIMVQSELARRQDRAYQAGKPRPFQSRYLLSGLLRCARCGSFYTLTLGKLRKDGSRSKTYRCPSTMAASSVGELKRADYCDASPYHLEELEGFVLSEIEQMRLDVDSYEITSRSGLDIDKEQVRIAKRIHDIEKAEGRLVDLYVDGKMPMSAINAKRDALITEKQQLRDAQQKAEKDVAEFTRADVRDLFSRFAGSIRELDPDIKRKLVRSLIDRIDLDGGDINIRWRFY